MVLYTPKQVLVLAPHTDDAEYGCAGTISRLIREFNSNVYCVCFSAAEESVPVGFPKDVLRREARNAADVLSIPQENYFIYSYKVRNFYCNRQAILDDMISLRSLISPDLVILPSSGDIHQDHKVIYEEESGL